MLILSTYKISNYTQKGMFSPLLFSQVSNSIKQSFMLDFVVALLIVVFFILLFTLLIVKFVNGFEALHGPVSQFPCLTPTNIHGLRTYNYDY